MKKIINPILTIQLTIILAIFVHCSVLTGFAETIGNPGGNLKPGCFEMGIGVDYGKRNIEIDSDGYKSDGDYDWNAQYLRGSYSFSNNFRVMAQIGIAELTSDDQMPNYFGDGEGTSSDFDRNIFYGIGFDAVVFQQDKFKMGIQFQINQFDTDMTVDNYYSIFSDDPDINVNWSNNMNLSFLHYYLSVGASYHYNEKFIPYAGLSVVKSDGDMDVDIVPDRDTFTLNYTLYRTKTISSSVAFDDTDLNIYGGFDYYVNPKMKANMEIRLVGETAVSLNLSYEF